jgi:hypothetical protein
MPLKGYHFSEEHKKKLGLSKFGYKNPMWKGDNIMYKPLHQWIRNNLTIPKNCGICGLEKRLDAANVTGIYNKDFINWKYICRSCHMLSDGRMYNLRNQYPNE